jgi:hypothetical protein
VPDEVYAIAEVYVHRMAATAPPYSRPDIVRGEQGAGAPLIESGQEHQQPPMESRASGSRASSAYRRRHL